MEISQEKLEATVGFIDQLAKQKKVLPPQYEAVYRIRHVLNKAIKRKVTYEELAEALNKQGWEITAETLRQYLSQANNRHKRKAKDDFYLGNQSKPKQKNSSVSKSVSRTVPVNEQVAEVQGKIADGQVIEEFTELIVEPTVIPNTEEISAPGDEVTASSNIEETSVPASESTVEATLETGFEERKQQAQEPTSESTAVKSESKTVEKASQSPSKTSVKGKSNPEAVSNLQSAFNIRRR